MKKYLLIFLLLLPTIYADVYVANSADWKTTYSIGVLAGLQGKEFHFLVSPKHSEVLMQEIPKKTTITVFESDTIPYVKKYANRLNNNEYKADTIIVPEKNSNLEIAIKYGFKKYIIVDPVYGYNAISALPYAITNKYYVLFADQNNINEVYNFLRIVNPEHIIIFGDVHEQVKSTLIPFNPEIIHKGSRFRNNIEMAEKYRITNNPKQALLTSGRLLEQEFFKTSVAQPIIFLSDRTPDYVENYIMTSNYQALVLIDNELMSSAKSIKDAGNIPLFVKFAKGIAGEGGILADVKGLDTMPVPSIDLLLKLQNIIYNADTREILFIIQNDKKSRTYLTTSIIIKSDGTPVITVGDDTTQKLEDTETKMFVYPTDLTRYLGTNLTAEILTIYGATEDEFEKQISEKREIQILTEADLCDIEIKSAEYDENTQRFSIQLNADNCYAITNIKDIMINNQITTIHSEIEQIRGTKTITIKQPMTKIDMADNPEITVEVRHGSRPDLLIQRTTQHFPLKLKEKQTSLTTILIGAIVLLALIIIALLWTRPKKRR